ncbi:hypothetical protein DFJ73DRAFT_832063 [Zopfochytrium polystomum]|nr:hypothetical protein DFJ73DRAFT_832063 [Zopfochytrium polystomum]
MLRCCCCCYCCFCVSTLLLPCCCVSVDINVVAAVCRTLSCHTLTRNPKHDTNGNRSNPTGFGFGLDRSRRDGVGWVGRSDWGAVRVEVRAMRSPSPRSEGGRRGSAA